MRYRARVVDSELRQRLLSTGAVVIEGPKACGKTATARNLVASEVLLDVDENARQAVAVDPRLVLAGDTPRLGVGMVEQGSASLLKFADRTIIIAIIIGDRPRFQG